MLQQLKIRNFLSFKDEMTFNMQPNKGTKLKDHKAKPFKGATVLKSAAIFGANSSGKSNFIKAIKLAKSLIVQGTNHDEPIDYHPFRLSNATKDADTTMVFHILCNEKKYEYGFSYNSERISSEWLSQITPKTVYSIYTRNEANEFDLKELLKRNPKDEERQYLRFFAKSTPVKQLFLHEVSSRNIKDNVSDISDLVAVFSWFALKLKIIFPDTPYNQSVLLKTADDKDLNDAFRLLLKYFATGIDDVYLKNVEFEKLGIAQELIRMIKANVFKDDGKDVLGTLKQNHDMFLIRKVNGELDTKKVMTVHHIIETGEKEYFSLEEESDGTNRLFDYIPLILDFIQGDKVFVIDEIERSLHPSLIEKILELYFRYSGKTPCQMIFTTHEVILMTQSLLRSDEIWLVNRNDDGVSLCNRLDEKFNPRFDKKLVQSYLKGDFDAVPKIESVSKFEDIINQLRLKN